MSFVQINEELGKAQQDLEKAIRTTIEAEEKLDNAKIALVQAESAKKKARLDLKLYQERLNSIKEQAWNLRKEASL